MTLTCIVVEDEPLAVERLVAYVRQQLPLLHLLATFDNTIDALSFVKKNRVDVIFLDIRLGGMSGMELLETSVVSSQAILTTAHHEYALKAYDLKVADYLFKPFAFPRFVQAVDRVRQTLVQGEVVGERQFIFVKTELRLEKVDLRHVLYIEGMRDYRQIRTVRKRIMTLQTFGEFERRIAGNVICRVHKSFMVALDKIESIERDYIKMPDALIPTSETYREGSMP
jgi:DNA-binding LytR/AlgR family response regulator